MTDTPIYDQVRNDLSTDVAGLRQTAEPSSTGKRGERGATSTVSVWALVDANKDSGGRRRRT